MWEELQGLIEFGCVNMAATTRLDWTRLVESGCFLTLSSVWEFLGSVWTVRTGKRRNMVRRWYDTPFVIISRVLYHLVRRRDKLKHFDDTWLAYLFHGTLCSSRSSSKGISTPSRCSPTLLLCAYRTIQANHPSLDSVTSPAGCHFLVTGPPCPSIPASATWAPSS
jgi:hypothetical protein